MFVSFEETIIKGKKSISLDGVSRITFHNVGSVGCKIGLKPLGQSETRIITTDGHVFSKSKLDIKFDNNQSGELYVETQRFNSCNK